MVTVDHITSAGLSYSKKVTAGEDFSDKTPTAYEIRLIPQSGEDVFWMTLCLRPAVIRDSHPLRRRSNTIMGAKKAMFIQRIFGQSAVSGLPDHLVVLANHLLQYRLPVFIPPISSHPALLLP